MQQLQGRLLRRDDLAPGWQRWTLHLPPVAARARPGQLLALQMGSSPWEPLLKQPFHIAGADAQAGTVTLVMSPVEVPSPASDGSLTLLGPIGRGWNLAEHIRNALLLGTARSVGALLFLADLLSARTVNVTLLVGADVERPALPPALLPAAVEYQFVRGPEAAAAALELLDHSLIQWADALFTTLPLPVYPALADQVRKARVRWQPGFAQGLLVPPMACFTGICDVCLVPEARRAWRACVDGPQCDLRDFAR